MSGLIANPGPLGLCNSCCATRKTDPEQPVRDAVTMVPAQVPIIGPGGVVVGVGVIALPQCWDHIPGGMPSQLVVPNGGLPQLRQVPPA